MAGNHDCSGRFCLICERVVSQCRERNAQTIGDGETVEYIIWKYGVDRHSAKEVYLPKVVEGIRKAGGEVR